MNITDIRQTHFPARVYRDDWMYHGWYYFTGVTATAGNGQAFYEVGKYRHDDAVYVWLTKEGVFMAVVE